MSDELGDTLYGFGKSDADYLVSIIPGTGSRDEPIRKGFRFHMILAKTGGSGIAANSSATVYYREPTSTGWADTSTEYTAYNQHPTAAVGNNSIVVLAPINGRWVVVTEFCA
jgi:hypothetical protein